jgi:CRP-like cAMP-binding protein
MDQATTIDDLSTLSPFIAKLEMRGRLADDDRDALASLCSDVRTIKAHKDIISEGANPDHVHLMLSGWAARYKIVPDGGRQITAFLIPGDFCDAHVAVLRRMDHGILALTDAKVAYVAHADFDALPLRSTRLARALWWATLVDEAVLRAWIVNIGRRDAFGGVSHLICELHTRMRNVGLVDEGRFELPLTQEVLADALGLTPVHVNRVLQRLRSETLITLKGRNLEILDPDGLKRAAGFDPSYLHARPSED